MMQASGALQLLCSLLAKPLEWAGIPADAAPLVVVRPFSGLARLPILDDLYRRLGPDAPASRVASTIMGCTETVFYTVVVYFGSIGIKNTRHTIPAALISMLAGVLMSGILCMFL